MPRTPPPPPRPPRFPRVTILPKRSEQSGRLDVEVASVPFMPWQRFNERVTFNQGEHITLIGKTKSGKTTAVVQPGGILSKREFACVLATKPIDEGLYPPLLRQGFVMTDDPKLDRKKTPKVIFRPNVLGPSEDDRKRQTEQFRAVILAMFAQGGWAIYLDEVRYLSDLLKLKVELETLWLQGSSLGLTIIAATQEPVSIPRVAFGQIEHLFYWKQTARERVIQMGELAGTESDIVRGVVPKLPQHEALYIGVAEDVLIRTIYSR
jgi:energy-coupling factor transporter ATP-binding protein EcfA2